MNDTGNSRRRQGLLVFFVAVSAFAVYLLVRGCAQDEETRVRKVVNAGAFCVEKKDVGRCASLISDNYEDQYGNRKLALLKIVSQIIKEYQDIKVEVRQLNVDVKDGQATADIGFKVYFRRPEDTGLYYDNGKLGVKLGREGGFWKVWSVEYSGSSEILFLQSVA